MRLSNFVRDENGWETKSRIPRFADDHLAVVSEVVQAPGSKGPRSWTTIYRKAAVIIAAMTRDEEFLLVRQERVPIRAAIWEMPAGQIDGILEPNDEQIRATALRELREETGHQLTARGEVISLGHYFSSPGFTDEHGYLLLARPVEPAAATGSFVQEDSILDCRAFSVTELGRMIAANEIRDANTLSMCASLAARGFLALNPQA